MKSAASASHNGRHFPFEHGHEVRPEFERMEIGSENWKALIQTGAEKLGISAPRAALDLFGLHAHELMRWNRRINLTAITDPVGVAVKHYIDSIVPADLVPEGAKLLDIGSGGGFPGIPLKILLPATDVTVIDAVRKKASFLGHIGRVLNFTDYRALHYRVPRKIEKEAAEVTLQGQDSAPVSSDGRHCWPYDVIVSRALAPLDAFFLLARGFLAPKGLMIALKGRVSATELAAARGVLETGFWGARKKPLRPVLSLQHYRLPYVENDRCVVAVRFD